MRDPAASLRFEGNRVIRDLYKPLDRAHFLHTELAQRWSTEGRLVPFAVHGETRVESQRLSFVSQPSEWSDAQLFAAAKLTLELQMEAVDASFDLKDGSAWNVIFDGCRPVFCDLLSFEGLCERPWWAFGQYGRHFLLPLLVSKRAGLRAHASFSAWRDGMPPGVARDMLGWTAMLGRYGALLAGRKNSAHSSVAVERAAIGIPLDDIQKFRRRLHAALDWQLSGLKPAPPSAQGWADYEKDRPHYSGDSLSSKRRLIGEWLAQLSPQWVLDLGCNTGEFSTMALEVGAHVVALDGDHDCVQQLFLNHKGSTRLYPVVASLDDLRSSRGWAGAEHPGMEQRLQHRADVVLMLALIHHLAVGAAVPLKAIASFAYKCARRVVIVELLDVDDPQLVALCLQRQRLPQEFSLALQRAAFVDVGFSILSEHRLEGAARSLLLLSK